MYTICSSLIKQKHLAVPINSLPATLQSFNHQQAGDVWSLSRYNPVKGLFGSWLTPDWYQEGGALWYKVVGRAHIPDSIINQYN